MTREQLLESIHSFLERHKMSKVNFGVLAANDHGFVGKLEKGKANPSLERIERIQTFMTLKDAELAA